MSNLRINIVAVLPRSMQGALEVRASKHDTVRHLRDEALAQMGLTKDVPCDLVNPETNELITQLDQTLSEAGLLYLEYVGVKVHRWSASKGHDGAHASRAAATHAPRLERERDLLREALRKAGLAEALNGVDRQLAQEFDTGSAAADSSSTQQATGVSRLRGKPAGGGGGSDGIGGDGGSKSAFALDSSASQFGQSSGSGFSLDVSEAQFGGSSKPSGGFALDTSASLFGGGSKPSGGFALDTSASQVGGSKPSGGFALDTSASQFGGSKPAGGFALDTSASQFGKQT